MLTTSYNGPVFVCMACQPISRARLVARATHPRKQLSLRGQMCSIRLDFKKVQRGIDPNKTQTNLIPQNVFESSLAWQNDISFLDLFSNRQACANVYSRLRVGKNFACLDSICYRLATHLLIMITRLGYTNTYIHKLCQKMAYYRKEKKWSKQIEITIAETGILCSVTSPRRH